MAPSGALLDDGARLHLQHGPIDLIIDIDGESGEVERARAAAWGRFQSVLDELVEDLARLRRPFDPADGPLSSSVARRMCDAVLPHSDVFVTPMAAVAGSVADEIRDVIIDNSPGIRRAFVNNGGDIALHLAAGLTYDVGLVVVPEVPTLAGIATISAEDGVRGVATSGRRGRSHSLGIADSVTVLAGTAAAADVAATLIANAVDLPRHPGVIRRPADDEDPDTDLGDRLVTISVSPLTDVEVEEALSSGRTRAEEFLERGLIRSAALTLSGATVAV